MITTAQAIERLRHALNTDQYYRETWVANIAMSIYDEIGDSLAPPAMPRDRLHQFCNRAAERFMSLLCADTRPTDAKEANATDQRAGASPAPSESACWADSSTGAKP